MIVKLKPVLLYVVLPISLLLNGLAWYLCAHGMLVTEHDDFNRDCAVRREAVQRSGYTDAAKIRDFVAWNQAYKRDLQQLQQKREQDYQEVVKHARWAKTDWSQPR